MPRDGMVAVAHQEWTGLGCGLRLCKCNHAGKKKFISHFLCPLGPKWSIIAFIGHHHKHNKGRTTYSYSWGRSQDQKYSSSLSLKFTKHDKGGVGVAGQKPPRDVSPWTMEVHGKHGKEDVLANYPPTSVHCCCLGPPAPSSSTLQWILIKWQSKSLNPSAEKKDFLLQVERQT